MLKHQILFDGKWTAGMKSRRGLILTPQFTILKASSRKRSHASFYHKYIPVEVSQKRYCLSKNEFIDDGE